MDGQFDRGYINTFRTKPALIYAPVCKLKKCDTCGCTVEANGVCGMRCKPKITLTEYDNPAP